MKARVLLLGGNGMLGSMIQKRILLNPNFELITTSRRPSEYEENFDVMKDDITNLIKRVNPEFVINCISLNPQNNAHNLFSFYQTFFINSVFPVPAIPLKNIPFPISINCCAISKLKLNSSVS